MEGIIILALKRDSYACGAANLAMSIKYYNPNIHITLVTDNTHLKSYRLEHFSNFDTIKEMNICDYTGIDGFCPAKAKLNIYKYSSSEKILYVDADSLVLQDLKPLFDKLSGSEFKSNVIEGYTQWIGQEYYKDFFGFDYGLTLNSSWFYWENDKVFKLANEFYNKGLDKSKMFQKWGGTLCDEVFFNASITKLGINVRLDKEIMFFGNVIDPRTLDQLQEEYCAFTLYGGGKGVTTVRDNYIAWYDKLLFKIWESKGFEHRFKAYHLLQGKHVSNK